MPPPSLSAFGRPSHEPAPHPSVPIDADGPADRAPSDPLFPPALQSAADVGRAIRRVRTISGNRVRNVIQQTGRDASLIAALRRQG